MHFTHTQSKHLYNLGIPTENGALVLITPTLTLKRAFKREHSPENPPRIHRHSLIHSSPEKSTRGRDYKPLIQFIFTTWQHCAVREWLRVPPFITPVDILFNTRGSTYMQAHGENIENQILSAKPCRNKKY